MRDARQSDDGLHLYRSFETPPADFDPNTAPDAVLLRYGLPRRPDPEKEPQLARAWKRAFSRPVTHIKAKLAVDPVLSGRDPLRNKDPEFGVGAWAGAIVRQGEPFRWVFAEWVIPEVPAERSWWGDDPYVGFWVGIDGWVMGNDQVVQAGVAAIVVRQ